MDRLKKYRIGIAGLGGLGSNVAASLCRIGIGSLVLVDFDRVEESNLNRQYYFYDQIGNYKAQALEENLMRINSATELEIHIDRLDRENSLEIFKDVDILVEALDNPEAKAGLVENFLSNRRIPIVAASGIAGYSSSNLIKTRRLGERLYIVGDGMEEEDSKDLFLAPRVILAAQHQANMVVRIIMGEEEA